MPDLTPLAILAFALIPVLLVLAAIAALTSVRDSLKVFSTRSDPMLFVSSVIQSRQGGDTRAADAMVQQLLASSRKDDAIIVYRMTRGVSLKEATEAVEAIERGLPNPIPS